MKLPSRPLWLLTSVVAVLVMTTTLASWEAAGHTAPDGARHYSGHLITDGDLDLVHHR